MESTSPAIRPRLESGFPSHIRFSCASIPNTSWNKSSYSLSERFNISSATVFYGSSFPPTKKDPHQVLCIKCYGDGFVRCPSKRLRRSITRFRFPSFPQYHFSTGKIIFYYCLLLSHESSKTTTSPVSMRSSCSPMP